MISRIFPEMKGFWCLLKLLVVTQETMYNQGHNKLKNVQFSAESLKFCIQGYFSPLIIVIFAQLHL